MQHASYIYAQRRNFGHECVVRNFASFSFMTVVSQRIGGLITSNLIHDT